MPPNVFSAHGITLQNRIRSYLVDDKRIIRIISTTRSLCYIDGMEVGVTFVGPAGIRRLNREWRGKDRSTDVLSFPQVEWARPVRIGVRPKTKSSDTHLGDIIISLDDARRNAKRIGQTMDREVCFLLVHGFLHLCGHDHLKQADEKLMLTAQRAAMKHLDGKIPTSATWRGCVRQRLRAGAGR